MKRSTAAIPFSNTDVDENGHYVIEEYEYEYDYAFNDPILMTASELYL